MIVINQYDKLQMKKHPDARSAFEAEIGGKDTIYLWVFSPSFAEYFLASSADLHTLADWIKENVK